MKSQKISNDKVIRDMTLSYISGKINKSIEDTEKLIGNILALIPTAYMQGEMLDQLIKVGNLEECVEILNEFI